MLFALFYKFYRENHIQLSIKNIIWAVFFIVLLLLTRNQFMFLYPVILLIYFGIFIIYKSKKNINYISM